MKRQKKETSIVEETSIEKIDNFTLESLHPIDNIENLSTYRGTLDKAFKNDDVTNIAITGPYGSGKSSLIRTYEKKINGEYLYLSLNYLHDIPSEKGYGNESIEKQNQGIANMLEKQIINQLINKIDHSRLEQSSCDIKKVYPSSTTFWYTVTISIFLLLSFIIFSHSDYFILINKNWNEYDNFFDRHYNGVICKFLIILLWILSIVIIIWNTTKKFLYNSILKRLKLYNVEFDNKKDRPEHDINLSEIIHIFKQAEIDVFVFEDLDRYKNTDIFIKLREINSILNKIIESDNKKKKPKDKKQIIRFIYLISDDLFTFMERTKLFDVIIPVVPIISTSNSRFWLKEKFSTMINDEDFFNGLAGYISDMRLLKSIYNEFNIYVKDLQNKVPAKGDKSFYIKQLAIIIYKNIFSSDYNELIHNKGFLYSIFRNHGDPTGECPLETKLKNNIITSEALFKDLVEKHDEQYISLLNFLLKNGYISEDYISYISYGYIESKDEEFISLILKIRKSNWDKDNEDNQKLYRQHSLSNCYYIIKEIEGFTESDAYPYFSSPYTLNISLIKFLLEEYDKDYNGEHLKKLFKTLEDKNYHSFFVDFIVKQSEESINLFIKYITQNQLWKNVISDIITDKIYTEEEKLEIIIKIIINTYEPKSDSVGSSIPKQDIEYFKNSDSIKEFIQEDFSRFALLINKLITPPEDLPLSPEYYDRLSNLCDVLEKLKVIFTNVDSYYRIDENTLDALYHFIDIHNLSDDRSYESF